MMMVCKDGFDNTVRTVSVQSDSKLIGGDYLNFNGTATPYLCRLFQDGTKDTSFNLGTSFNGKVYCSTTARRKKTFRRCIY
jgi:hypothetical protein